MKSSSEQRTIQKWINYPIQKFDNPETSQRNKINFQHPIQPFQNNHEYHLEGLDDAQQNGFIKFQEPKDLLNSPRSSQKLLDNQNKFVLIKINEEPKQDVLHIQNQNCIRLLDQFQSLKSNGKYKITPDSIFYQLLQIISFFINTLAVIFISIEALEENFSFHFLYLICFFIQIFLNLTQLNVLNVQGKLRNLCFNYIKSNFSLDLLIFVSIVLNIFIKSRDLKPFILLIIALIIQINRYKQQQSIFMQNIHSFNRYYNIYNKSIIFLIHILNYLMILNLLGCLLLQIVKEIDFFNSISISDQYFKSIYSVIEMNSHITPESSSQALGIAVINIIYIFLNAYILIEFYQFMKIDKSLTKLNTYFKEHQPDISIKLKLLSEVDKLDQFQFYKEQTQQLNESKEKRSVLCQYFRNLRLQTINQLVAKAQIKYYQQNQVIIQVDEADDSSIYFILEGYVLIQSKNGTELNRFSKSHHFGELSFYTNQLRTATVVSEGYCKLLKLSRSDFLSETNSLEKEPFFQTSDQILQKIKMPNQCFCCNSSNHYIHSCPQLIYHPDALQILYNADHDISRTMNQEGNKQFIRNRKSKLRILQKDLRKIDVSIYEQMRIDFQRVQSSLSSDGDLPYESDTQKYSVNSNSEKVSASPIRSESHRKIGIDYEFSTQSKHLKTIIEKEEEIDQDSPPLDKKQSLVTKSQGGELSNYNFNEPSTIIRSKSKSHQCITIKSNPIFDQPIQTFQNDFENIFRENEKMPTLDVDNIQNFERMEHFEAYFPHQNFKNQIYKANQSIQNKQNQYKE